MDALSDDIESVLFIARVVMGELFPSAPWLSIYRSSETPRNTLTMLTVYQVPPRTSATGYKASDWNVESFVWKGRLRVLEVGTRCELRLEVGHLHLHLKS